MTCMTTRMTKPLIATCIVQGTQIEGTFWGDAADKYFETIREGFVYYFTNGAVSPSNRKYSTVNNDYKITFKPQTVVEEAKDQVRQSDSVFLEANTSVRLPHPEMYKALSQQKRYIQGQSIPKNNKVGLETKSLPWEHHVVLLDNSFSRANCGTVYIL